MFWIFKLSWTLKENCSLKIHWKSVAKIVCLGFIWFSCLLVISSVVGVFCCFTQEKHTIPNVMIDFVPISRHNKKSFWTSVNSVRFAVSDIFNESSDCFQVQGLRITILWKTKVVLLFLCESLHACQSLAPLVETKTKKKSLLRLSLASFSPHHY